MALQAVSGSAAVPGAQVLVWCYPAGNLAILYGSGTLNLTTPILENPFTTNGVTGSYAFWVDSSQLPVRIVELK